MAVRRASVEPPAAASQAVTVVPMFMPNTVAAAASNVITPWLARVMAMAVVAADDWTIAVKTSETVKQRRSPPRVAASRVAKSFSAASLFLRGAMATFMQ